MAAKVAAARAKFKGEGREGRGGREGAEVHRVEVGSSRARRRLCHDAAAAVEDRCSDTCARAPHPGCKGGDDLVFGGLVLDRSRTFLHLRTRDGISIVDAHPVVVGILTI